VPEAAVEATKLADLRFWQYAYTQKEFVSVLSSSGFRVILRQGYSILWGLYDLPGVAEACSLLGRRLGGPFGECERTTRHQPEHIPGASAPSETARQSLLKRLVVSEDITVPVAGLFVRALRQVGANMMMYMCVRTN
jgi:hypothetical protein